MRALPTDPYSGAVIGIDARLYASDFTGIGIYTRGLVDSLARIDTAHRYRLFTDREVEAPSANFQVVRIPVRKRVIWTQLCLPLHRQARGLALYHAVANHELPLAPPAPPVVTVHDLIPLLFPRTVPWRHRRLFQALIGPAIRHARMVITDSEFVRRDLIDRFNLAPERVRTVPLGSDASFGAPVEPADVTRVRNRYRLGERYLLYVGALEPRKNLPALLEAFREVVSQPGHKEWQLVLAGGGGWGREEVTRLAAAPDLAERVRITGFVPDRELPALYRGASVFVYPSIYEGFGLPVLEAMAAGLPVLVSSPSALEELVGQAGMTFRLGEPADLGSKLVALVRDEALRHSLAAAGKDRAGRYTWERCARETLAVYESVLQEEA